MALQHLRTSTAHKRPIPSVMSAGQLAVNINEASPGLFFKDSNGDLVKVGPVHIGTNAPNSSPASVAADALVTGTVYQILTVGTSDFTLVGASANTVGTVFTATGTTTGTGIVSGQQGVEKGEQWLDTTGGTYVLKIYDGTAWRSESGTFVDVNGDTMTGALLLDNASSAAAPDLSFDGDANTGIYSPGADQVAISTGGTGRLFVNGNGNVAIGTTTAQAKLDVRTGAAGFAQFAHASGNGGVRITGEGGSSAANLVFSNNRGVSTSDEYTIQLSGADDALVFRSGGPADTERLRITSSGNVGIGTTTVDELLHVESSDTTVRLKVESTAANSYPGVRFTNDARTYDLQIDGATDAFRVFDSSASTERLRIDTSGRLLIGASSSSGTNATLQIVGDIGAQFHRGENSAGGASITISKSRSTTYGSYNVVQNNDTVGIVAFRADDGTDYNSYAALIGCHVDGTPGSNDMPGRLVFSTTADGSASPTERMRLDSSGNLGINTTSPGDLVEIKTGLDRSLLIRGNRTSSPVDLFAGNPAAGYGLRDMSFSANTLRFGTGASSGTTATERLRIDSLGNVGIGLSSPEVKLHTKESVLVSNTTSGDGNGRIEIRSGGNAVDTSTHQIRCGGGSGQSLLIENQTSSAGQLILASNHASGTINFKTNSAERLRIDSSGNVGVGTTSPGNTLHLSGTNGVGMRIENTSNSISAYSTLESSGALQANISGSGVFTWVTGGGEKVRIDNSGRLLIGTSVSPSGGDAHAQNAPLLVQGRIGSDADSGRINLQRGSAASADSSIGTISFTDLSNNAYARIAVEADAATGTDDYPGRIKFQTTENGQSNLTTRMTIKNNGNVIIPGQTLVGSDTAGTSKVRIDPSGYVNIQSNASAGEALRIFDSTSTQKATLKADGSATFAGSVSIGGTAAVNTIDEYEEGTFTPVLLFGSNTTGITYNGRAGFYVKVGKVVHAWVYINLSSKGTATGAAAISQFPFTSEDINVSGLGNWPGAQPSRRQNQTSSNLALTMVDNSINCAITDGAGVSVTDSSFTNGTILEFALCYRAA